MEFTYEAMEGSKPIFTTASETLVTGTKESYVSESQASTGVGNSLFSPLAPSFHSRDTSAVMEMLHQEPRPGDIAPPALHMDNEMLLNFRNSGSESMFGDVEHGHNPYFIGGGGRTESVTSNFWGEGSGSGSSASAGRNDDMVDTFDFLAKSISSANSYVSMLTREQLSVLRSFRPGLLYEFLQEVAKLRSEKRLRRAGPNECAFCKNNGENEECYTNHALKDWRGHVTCPVLRAFRCPRCGATGDRAHTIKYCPEYNENGGLERPGFARRRFASPSSSLLFGQQRPAGVPSAGPPTPAPTSLAGSSLWNFN